VNIVALMQVFSEYFGFPCQFGFHRFLHNHHHLSSWAGTIGQTVAAVPSGLSLMCLCTSGKDCIKTNIILTDNYQQPGSIHFTSTVQYDIIQMCTNFEFVNIKQSRLCKSCNKEDYLATETEIDKHISLYKLDAKLTPWCKVTKKLIVTELAIGLHPKPLDSNSHLHTSVPSEM
jgi:hypothetical protein